MKTNPKSINSESGFLLVALLIATFFIMSASIITAQLTLSNLQLATVEQYRVNAQFAADAGLDQTVQELNDDGSYTGAAETTLFQDTKIKTTYQTTVVDDTDP